MRLDEFLVSNGYMRPGASKACCPFHDDSTPSAQVHLETSSIWCYACRKKYTHIDFAARFGVLIDPPDPNVIAELKAPEFPWGTVLFYE